MGLIPTNQFLSALDLDQLVYARDLANDMIARKREQEKLIVWRVCDDFQCHGNFSDSDYVKAAELLLQKAKDFSNSNDKQDLSLTCQRVIESEYSQYVKT